MVETIPSYFNRSFKQPKIENHSGVCIAFTPHSHFSSVGVTVDPPAWFSVNLAMEGMSGLKPELLAKLEHQEIPRILCVCRLKCQRGCARQ